MKWIVCLLVIGLLVLHQDYWNWDNDKLVFGFLPYSIAYHSVISLAAAVVWSVAVRFCWPRGIVRRMGVDEGAS